MNCRRREIVNETFSLNISVKLNDISCLARTELTSECILPSHSRITVTNGIGPDVICGPRYCSSHRYLVTWKLNTSLSVHQYMHHKSKFPSKRKRNSHHNRWISCVICQPRDGVCKRARLTISNGNMLLRSSHGLHYYSCNRQCSYNKYCYLRTSVAVL